MAGDFFFALANKLTNEHKVPKVTVGMGGVTTAIFTLAKGMLKSTNVGVPINYTGCYDSEHQYVLSQGNCPYLFALFHKAAIPESWEIYLMSAPIYENNKHLLITANDSLQMVQPKTLYFANSTLRLL